MLRYTLLVADVKDLLSMSVSKAVTSNCQETIYHDTDHVGHISVESVAEVWSTINRQTSLHTECRGSGKGAVQIAWAKVSLSGIDSSGITGKTAIKRCLLLSSNVQDQLFLSVLTAIFQVNLG